MSTPQEAQARISELREVLASPSVFHLYQSEQEKIVAEIEELKKHL